MGIHVWLCSHLEDTKCKSHKNIEINTVALCATQPGGSFSEWIKKRKKGEQILVFIKSRPRDLFFQVSVSVVTSSGANTKCVSPGLRPALYIKLPHYHNSASVRLALFICLYWSQRNVKRQKRKCTMKLFDCRLGESKLWNHLKDNARTMFFELWPPILWVETISVM